MSNQGSGEQDELSKKERLINAWLAAGPEAQATTVAELTDASTGYASEINTDIEEGELDDEEIEAARDEDLIETYADQLEQSDDAGGNQEAGGEQPAQQRSQPPRQQPPQQQPPQGQQPPPQQSQQVPPQGQQPPQAPPQQPPQPQQQQPPQGPPQQTQQGLPAGGQQSVPVSQLQELDDLLAIYEEEAQFEAQNLPPVQLGGARETVHGPEDADAAPEHRRRAVTTGVSGALVDRYLRLRRLRNVRNVDGPTRI